MSSSEKDKDLGDDQKPSTSGDKGKDDKTVETIECAVCLQPCVQPVQLPCKHIFCYLCVKGVTHQSKRCAMCRQEIPANYLDNPCLIAVDTSPVAHEGSYQWFYEGRSGWWQYDERTSAEIETSFQGKNPQCEVLIAGFLYVIDFKSYVQYRRCDPSRRRRIKRDLITAAKKGVAGIRLPQTCDDATSNLQNLNLSDKSGSDSDACCTNSSVTSTSDDCCASASSSATSGPEAPAKRLKSDDNQRSTITLTSVANAMNAALNLTFNPLNMVLPTINAMFNGGSTIGITSGSCRIQIGSTAPPAGPAANQDSSCSGQQNPAPAAPVQQIVIESGSNSSGQSSLSINISQPMAVQISTGDAASAQTVGTTASVPVVAGPDQSVSTPDDQAASVTPTSAGQAQNRPSVVRSRGRPRKRSRRSLK